jgi:hypothetical protein
MHPIHTRTADVALTPADILRCAARYLQTNGWHQGAFYPERNQLAFPPACAAGAIRAAVCGRPARNLEDLPKTEQRMINAAQLVLAGYLDEDPHANGVLAVISDWNDEDLRTPAEIIDALDIAADEWDQLHSRAQGGRS